MREDPAHPAEHTAIAPVSASRPPTPERVCAYLSAWKRYPGTMSITQIGDQRPHQHRHQHQQHNNDTACLSGFLGSQREKTQQKKHAHQTTAAPNAYKKNLSLVRPSRGPMPAYVCECRVLKSAQETRVFGQTLVFDLVLSVLCVFFFELGFRVGLVFFCV